MISDKDKKYLTLIEDLINKCLKRTDDFYFIKGTFSELMHIYEELENKKLKFNIETKAKEILIATDPIKIKKYLNELLEIILISKKESESNAFICADKIERTDQYNKDCKRYKDNYNVKDVENKILSFSFSTKLHKKLKPNNRWPDHYKARLTDNLRIIYYYN